MGNKDLKKYKKVLKSNRNGTYTVRKTGAIIKILGRIEGTKDSVWVECSICSNDPELYPQKYFKTRPVILKYGQIPCGCSSRPKLSPEQYLIKIRRVTKEKGITVNGYAEEYHGADTRIECECVVCGNKWSPFGSSLKNGNSTGCPECHKPIGLYGYLPSALDKDDFLYVISFNNEYVKIGRSLDPNKRLQQLRLESRTRNLKLLYLVKDTHENIFSLEQYLHRRFKNLRHNPLKWESIECFDRSVMDSLHVCISDYYGKDYVVAQERVKLYEKSVMNIPSNKSKINVLAAFEALPSIEIE